MVFLNKVIFFPLFQDLSKATDLLSIKEVSLIGFLLFFLVILIYVVRKLFLSNENLNKLRLDDHKEFTKEMLNITEKTTETIRQINEILKISQKG